MKFLDIIKGFVNRISKLKKYKKGVCKTCKDKCSTKSKKKK